MTMNLVAPRQLTSKAEIARVFKRGLTTVNRWIEEGAPIHFDGRLYGADYHQLNDWLVKNKNKNCEVA